MRFAVSARIASGSSPVATASSSSPNSSSHELTSGPVTSAWNCAPQAGRLGHPERLQARRVASQRRGAGRERRLIGVPLENHELGRQRPDQRVGPALLRDLDPMPADLRRRSPVRPRAGHLGYELGAEADTEQRRALLEACGRSAPSPCAATDAPPPGRRASHRRRPSPPRSRRVPARNRSSDGFHSTSSVPGTSPNTPARALSWMDDREDSHSGVR